MCRELHGQYQDFSQPPPWLHVFLFTVCYSIPSTSPHNAFLDCLKVNSPFHAPLSTKLCISKYHFVYNHFTLLKSGNEHRCDRIIHRSYFPHIEHSNSIIYSKRILDHAFSVFVIPLIQRFSLYISQQGCFWRVWPIPLVGVVWFSWWGG